MAHLRDEVRKIKKHLDHCDKQVASCSAQLEAKIREENEADRENKGCLLLSFTYFLYP